MKITDFGLSRVVGPTSFMNTMCGTPQYLAPEVASAKSLPNGYGIAVDMWSLGVILYVLLSGRMPFVHPQEMPPERPPILKQIQEGLYDFSEEQWSGRSNSVRNLIDSLLTVQPERRATAKEVMEHSWMKSLLEPTEDEVAKVKESREALTHELSKKREREARSLSPPFARPTAGSPRITSSPSGEKENQAKKPRIDAPPNASPMKTSMGSPRAVSPRGTSPVFGSVPNPASKAKAKPMCRYGDACYRTNPAHYEEFSHPPGHLGPRAAAGL